MTSPTKHYVVRPTTTNAWDVVCLEHTVVPDVKLEEANALASALNIEAARKQQGFGK